MAALRNRLIVGGMAGLVGLTGGYWVAYPYVRDMYYVTKQLNENNAYNIKKIEDAYKTLQDHPECNSLLKKHLTQNVVDKLKYKKTKLGATLYDVIRSGVYNPDSSVGVYAPDAESYKVFAALFDPIIQEYHGFGPNDKQPDVDLGDGRTKELEPLDPDGKFIISTRIRCGRTLDGYPFNPFLTGDDYLIMQEKVKKALEQVKDNDLKGTYYPLKGMKKETQNQLIADHFLFKEGDRHLQHANACKFWPVGRGIFHNNDKTFLIWVNEEDHLRLISMQQGSDVGKVLDRLIRGVKSIESKVPFARDSHLGYLTFCPTNLGSTVRASVHIRLPKVSARKDFKEICDKLNLQVRGIHGEHSESEGGVMDISNKQRLGISEYQAVRQMYDGVKKLIEMETK
jgi:protein-arginine kinase